MCGRSNNERVLLPKTGAEILNCDKCTLFVVFGPNGEREETPDFLVYLTIPTEEPLFSFVEFKPQPETHAIDQFKKGINVLQERYKYFSVVPKPQKLDCVIAYDRSKGMAHAAQVALILGTKFYYQRKPSVIRIIHWGEKLFPKIR